MDNTFLKILKSNTRGIKSTGKTNLVLTMILHISVTSYRLKYLKQVCRRKKFVHPWQG